jgi:orotidine-5'-phosphate decarboxylase
MDGSILREKSQSIPGTSSLSRGIVSFFELGLWLASTTGFDGLLDELLKIGKKIFLDAKMFDIDEVVKRAGKSSRTRRSAFSPSAETTIDRVRL